MDGPMTNLVTSVFIMSLTTTLDWYPYKFTSVHVNTPNVIDTLGGGDPRTENRNALTLQSIYGV